MAAPPFQSGPYGPIAQNVSGGTSARVRVRQSDGSMWPPDPRPASLDQTLERIDAAMGCQQCGNPLGPSPSDDFCGEGCQHVWHARRAQASAPHIIDAARLLEIRLHTRPPEVEPAPAATAYASGGVVWGSANARVGEEYMAHFEVREDGSIVDNTRAIVERQHNANMDIRGWIPPEVWDYITRED